MWCKTWKTPMEECYCDTSPWVLFTFFVLYKWYQIGQSITDGSGNFFSLWNSVEKRDFIVLIHSPLNLSNIQCRGGSRTAATSKMECFVIIVNGFQPLSIIKKHCILDIAAALDPPLQRVQNFRSLIKSPLIPPPLPPSEYRKITAIIIITLNKK